MTDWASDYFERGYLQRWHLAHGRMEPCEKRI